MTKDINVKNGLIFKKKIWEWLDSQFGDYFIILTKYFFIKGLSKNLIFEIWPPTIFCFIWTKIPSLFSYKINHISKFKSNLIIRYFHDFKCNGSHLTI